MGHREIRCNCNRSHGTERNSRYSSNNDSRNTGNPAQNSTAANTASTGGRGDGNHGAGQSGRGRGHFGGVNRPMVAATAVKH